MASLSAYISRNLKDIESCRGREEHYPYSNYGIYVGIAEDDFQILDPYFIPRVFSDGKARARRLYREFVSVYDENGSSEGDPEFAHERKTEIMEQSKITQLNNNALYVYKL